MTEPFEFTAAELEELGDRMDGNYTPPILIEPTGGPIPTSAEEATRPD